MMYRFPLTLFQDSYLLDQGPHDPLYVWVGAKADNAAVSQALSRGQVSSLV